MELVNRILQNKLVRSALIALCGAILTVLTDAVTAWVSGSGLTVNQAAVVMGAWSWVVNAIQTWLRQFVAESEADKDAMELQHAIADRPLTPEQVQQMRGIVDRSIAENAPLRSAGPPVARMILFPLFFLFTFGTVSAAEDGPSFRVSHLRHVAVNQKISIDVELDDPKEAVVVRYRVMAAFPQNAHIELDDSCGLRCLAWCDPGAYEVEIEVVRETNARARTVKTIRFDAHASDDRKPLPRPQPLPPQPIPDPPGPVVPVPAPPAPQPNPQPSVVPDTMGISAQVIAAAKAANDRAGALSLADRSSALARDIRQREAERARAVALGQTPPPSITAAQVIPRIAAGIKETGPKWAAFLTAAKACLQQLLANGKLTETDVTAWATLLEEIAAALREAAKN